MAWYDRSGQEADVVLSSRVRVARNLEGYAFEPRLTADKAKEIIDKAKAVFTPEKGYTFTDFAALSPVEREAYAERYTVSAEFAAKNTPHALISKEDDGTYIMVCEEDHLRIQSIVPGFDLKSAYEHAEAADSLADEGLDIAYSEKLGYLTHCPTNLGTGMRASVMMFLPALTAANQIRALSLRLQKIGLTVRGMSGEGSRADAALYQISNQITLGVSEEDLIDKLDAVVKQIIVSERRIREEMKKENGERLFDMSRRALGTALYSQRMDYAEFLEIYEKLRLGIALGCISECDYARLDKLRIETGRAVISEAEGLPENDTAARDRARAALVKKTLAA